jgi:peptidoglycan/LPS O-acetylase OafA/YrhL
VTQALIALLIGAIIFAVIAYAMYWVCTHFFPNFPPALWICGAILLIVLLLWIGGQLPGGPVLVPLHK